MLYPDSEKYTTDAVVKAVNTVLPDWNVRTARDGAKMAETGVDVQLCDYDELDWDVAGHPDCLTSAYINRKVCSCPVHAEHG